MPSDERYVIEFDANGVAQVTRGVKRMGATGAAATKQFNLLGRALLLIGTYMSARAVIEYGDAWTQLNNKLRIVTDSEEALVDTRKKLLNISRQTRSDIEGNVTLFQRLALANRNLGKSDQELLDFTEAVSKSLAISGATAQEARSVLIQLAQGLGSTAVRGEEFRAVMESAPRLMLALSDATDMTTGQLKEMTAQGQFLSRDFFEAIMTQIPQIDSDFEKFSKTVSQATAVARTNLTEFIGKINETSGAGEKLADTIIALSNNFGKIAAAAAVIAAVALASWAATVNISFAALNTTLLATVLKLVAVTAAMFGLFEAFKTFVNETKKGQEVILALGLAAELTSHRLENWKVILKGSESERAKLQEDLEGIRKGYAGIRSEIDATDFGDETFGEKLFANITEDMDRIVDLINGKMEGIEPPKLIPDDVMGEEGGIGAFFEQMKAIGEEINFENFFGGISAGFESVNESAMKFKDNVAAITSDTIKSFSDGLTEALTGGEADFRAIARTAVQSLISIMIQAMLTKAILAGISAFGGGGGADSGGAVAGKQFGGPVQAGQPVMVGERRPEIFVPQTAGRIEQVDSGGGSQQESVNIINVVDQQMFIDAMASTAGQKQLMNVINKNRSSLRG